MFTSGTAAPMSKTQLSASDGAESDAFGHAVAISGDHVAIGALYDDDSGLNSGSVYVYRWNGTNYDEIKLTATDGEARDYLGYSIAMDGDQIAVGALLDSDNGYEAGSAYVFKWNGSGYDQHKVIASDGAAGDRFGISIDISGDNFVVGSHLDDDNGVDSGSAYVYRWNGTGYDEYKLTASDGVTLDNYGASVAIDGDYVLVGANGVDGNGSDSGRVYLYKWNGADYVEEMQFNAPDAAADDNMGAVGISGNSIVVGSIFDDDNGTDSGSAYVFSIGAPAIPTGLTDSIAGVDASLDWFNVPDNYYGLKEYIVEYADNDTFTGATSQSVTASELDLSGLAEGTYYWRVKSVDNNDNASAWSVTDNFSIDIIDVTPPSVPTGLVSEIVDGKINFDWDDSIDAQSGVEYYYFFITGGDDSEFGTWVSGSKFTNYDIPSDGIYNWNVIAYDNAGNFSDWAEYVQLVVDTTPPSVSNRTDVCYTG